MRVYSNLVQLREFLHKVDIAPIHFVIPGVLSFATVFFEGVAMGLLIPLTKGVIEMDFGFVRDIPVLGSIVATSPRVFIASDAPVFILLVGLIFAAGVLKNSLGYAASLSIAYQAAKFSHGMRKLIFHRYLTFGKLFFDRTNTGHLINVLISFVNMISGQLAKIHDMLIQILSLFVYLGIMFAISWKLLIVILFTFPLLYYSSEWVIRKIKTISKDLAVSQGMLSGRIFNTLSCIPLVKSYSGEQKEKREFDNMSSLTAKLGFNIRGKMNLIAPLQEIAQLTGILVLIAAAALIVVKAQSPGQLAGLLVFFYLARKSHAAFGSLGRTRASAARIYGPIKEMSKILDDKDKFFIAEGQRELGGLRNRIEFNNLNFSYLKTVPVLKDVTFSVERGKMTAIVGPTGAGKTTLISLLLRFYDCPPASIMIDGVDIRNFTLRSLRAHMALVSQDTFLFNDTIRNNIAYGLDGVADEKLISVVKKARLWEFITELPDGFDTLIGDRGVKLSGGEKQRVSIARAMLKGPEILIQDEATSSLDTRTERLIQESIEEAIGDKTAIVIAHRLSTIKNADKIVVIEDGRLVEEGPLNELLEKKGKFYHYWQDQKFY